MTGTHAHARAFVEQRRGVCTWRFEWEDVAITCDHLRLTETVVFECRAIITRDGRWWVDDHRTEALELAERLVEAHEAEHLTVTG